MSLTNGQLLDEIGVPRGFAAHRIATSGVAAKPVEPRPWYVQTAVALVIWVGAMLFASFLAAIDVLENPVVEIVFGIGFLAVGAIGSRHPNGLLRLHLSLLAYAGAASLLSVFADRGLGLRHEGFFLWIAAVQLVCLALFDSRPVRFKATIGAALAMFAFVADTRIPLGMDLLVVALAAAAVAWWLGEARLSASVAARAVRPVGFGLVLAALGAGLFSLFDSRDVALTSPLFVTVALGALLVLVVTRAAQEAGARLRSAVVVVALVGVIAISALASEAPALLCAALVLALGRTRKEPLLDVAGAIGLVLFVARVYYSLDLSLLWTSFGLGAAGALVLVARAFLLRGEGDGVDVVATTTGSVLSPIVTLPKRSSLIVLAPALVVSLVVMGLVAKKEQQLAQGQTVLLRLAPVDPRSLMQGDYMALRYELAQQIPFSAESDGTVRAHLDADRVATSIVPSDADDDDAVDVNWHRVRGQVVFGADSFFFSEGDGERIARAAFAEVRVTPDGTPVLVRLLDASRTSLTP